MLWAIDTDKGVRAARCVPPHRLARLQRAARYAASVRPRPRGALLCRKGPHGSSTAWQLLTHPVQLAVHEHTQAWASLGSVRHACNHCRAHARACARRASELWRRAGLAPPGGTRRVTGWSRCPGPRAPLARAPGSSTSPCPRSTWCVCLHPALPSAHAWSTEERPLSKPPRMLRKFVAAREPGCG